MMKNELIGISVAEKDRGCSIPKERIPDADRISGSKDPFSLIDPSMKYVTIDIQGRPLLLTFFDFRRFKIQIDKAIERSIEKHERQTSVWEAARYIYCYVDIVGYFPSNSHLVESVWSRYLWHRMKRDDFRRVAHNLRKGISPEYGQFDFVHRPL